VPLHLWGCRGHWFTLPIELRIKITNAYSDRDRAGWKAANEEAQAWIAGIPERAKESRSATPLPLSGSSAV
jgi:hypothetical protein